MDERTKATTSKGHAQRKSKEDVEERRKLSRLSSTDHLPKEVVEECKEAFGMFDHNDDGTISYHELATVMRLLGNNPTEDELSEIMKDLDLDGSGSIDFQEFLGIVAKHWKDPVDEEKELMEAFEVFDRDGDGFVVASEIQYVMKQHGHDLEEAEITKMISEVDKDGDGRLNYQEFVHVMQEKWK